MIVLEMLRKHPLVHNVPVTVNILVDGHAVPDAWPLHESWPEVVHTMELPFLVYGEAEVPEQPFGNALPVHGVCLPEPKGAWDYLHDHSPGEHTVKVPEGFFFIRRDADLYGPRREWVHHLFFTPERTEHIRSIPPFWENPPIARLQPWKDVVDTALRNLGFEKRLVKVREPLVDDSL